VYRDKRHELLDLSQPFLADVYEAQTGWLEEFREKGVQPGRQWNAEARVFEPVPREGKWRKGMQMRIITAKGELLLWEQASYGAGLGLAGMFAQVREQDGWDNQKLTAQFVHVGAQAEGRTQVPQFALVGRAPKPAEFRRPMPESRPRQPNAKPEDETQTASDGGGYRQRMAASSGGAPVWDAPPAGRFDDEIPF
jgi:hypothetical protein